MLRNGNPGVFDLQIKPRPDGTYVVTPLNLNGKDYLNQWIRDFDHSRGNAFCDKDDLAQLYKSCMRIKWVRN